VLELTGLFSVGKAALPLHEPLPYVNPGAAPVRLTQSDAERMPRQAHDALKWLNNPRPFASTS